MIPGGNVPAVFDVYGLLSLIATGLRWALRFFGRLGKRLGNVALRGQLHCGQILMQTPEQTNQRFSVVLAENFQQCPLACQRHEAS